MGSIEVEALTYIRGRSIPDQFIIIDEAQNLTKHEVKTILTRVGEKSKIVLMGDPQQIDHPYLDEYNNGLTYVVEKFKEQRISGHVKFVKGERSNLAQLAADLLKRSELKLTLSLNNCKFTDVTDWILLIRSIIEIEMNRPVFF